MYWARAKETIDKIIPGMKLIDTIRSCKTGSKGISRHLEEFLHEKLPDHLVDLKHTGLT